MKMKLECKRQTMEISCVFIDHYMTSCPPVYSLIYIFSMKKLLHGEAVSIADVARQFNVTESDVHNAWKHWENMGIVKLENPENDLSIAFLPVDPPVGVSAPLVEPIKMPINSRPQYTNDELAVYRLESPEIARLFECGERALGKLLTPHDAGVLFSFHDWLRLPFDVIEYLLVYCADNDHRNLRYIEKCALDWADNGIDELEKALQYVQNFDKNYRTILHYMGQTSGYPTPSHRKYMDKWLDEWAMPLDLIMEACDRCVSELNKPKFNYVDKILSNWHKKEIRDIAGVKAADAEFTKEKAAGIIPINKIEKNPAKPKANRFVNFSQRDNDYAKWEQMERAYLEQKLK